MYLLSLRPTVVDSGALTFVYEIIIIMGTDITFDYVLNNVVGAAGKYQWIR